MRAHGRQLGSGESSLGRDDVGRAAVELAVGEAREDELAERGRGRGAEHGLHVVGARPFNLVGPGEPAAMLTSATAGKVVYAVNDQATTGVLVKVVFNPADPAFVSVPGALAITKTSTIGNEVVGGEIVYRETSAAGVRNLIAHELGHTFGLGHPTPRGIMNSLVDAGLPDYSDAEKLAIAAMLSPAYFFMYA